MRLSGDGTVTMRLNCNRATGTWKAGPSADPSSGRFEFGPLAGTRALCPPPSLDERVTGQSQFVHSYLLTDGRLHLSLMADGGIYIWEPSREVAFEASADADLEAAIRKTSPSYTRATADAGGTNRARYVYTRLDLNGDGREEVFVYMLGSVFCGTGGCNLLLFGRSDAGYVLVNDFAASRIPVIASQERSNGWFDIARLESGGGAPARYVKYTFDGTRYVERERTAATAAPDGLRLLAGDPTFDNGVPLEPSDAPSTGSGSATPARPMLPR